MRLEHLTLGSAKKGYYNPYWSTAVNGKSPEINVNKAIYLKTFNLYNCAAYRGGLNFSNCQGIEKILLTGSQVNSLTLPVGGVLTELRLPPTISNLKIDSHTQLTAPNFSMGGYEYGSDNLIGGNGKYTSDYSGLTALEVINTKIDTYSMVCGARNLERYRLLGVEWEITNIDTQYCLRLNDADLDYDINYLKSILEKIEGIAGTIDMTKENAMYVAYLLHRIDRFQEFLDDIEDVVNHYTGDLGEIEAPLWDLLNAELARREEELKDFDIIG